MSEYGTCLGGPLIIQRLLACSAMRYDRHALIVLVMESSVTMGSTLPSRTKFGTLPLERLQLVQLVLR